MSASGVVAQDFLKSFTDRLVSDGFARITVSRTLLGRTRIVAEDDTREREIIFNPRTGVVLRDYLLYLRNDREENDEYPESEEVLAEDEGDDEEDDDDDNGEEEEEKDEEDDDEEEDEAEDEDDED